MNNSARKPVLWIFIILIVALVGGVFYFLNRLDGIVSNLIEQEGSAVLQSKVSVDGLHIDLTNSTASLQRLTVANPPEFSDANAIELADFAIKLRASSLTEDTIVIESVTVGGAAFLVEQTSAGNNLQKLSNASQQSGGGEAETGSSESPAVSIKQFSIKNIRGHLLAPQFNQDESMSLGDIELSNIGGPNGAPPQELAKQLLQPLLAKIIQSSAGQQIKSKIKDKFEEQKGKMLEKLFNKRG
ncbi:MAG: hypothetical protein AAF542_06370 [Pseudomonadota bacterium]